MITYTRTKPEETGTHSINFPGFSGPTPWRRSRFTGLPSFGDHIVQASDGLFEHWHRGAEREPHVVHEP